MRVCWIWYLLIIRHAHLAVVDYRWNAPEKYNFCVFLLTTENERRSYPILCWISSISSIEHSLEHSLEHRVLSIAFVQDYYILVLRRFCSKSLQRIYMYMYIYKMLRDIIPWKALLCPEPQEYFILFAGETLTTRSSFQTSTLRGMFLVSRA